VTTFARRLAAERPREIALADGATELSWAEVDDRCNRIANALAGASFGAERRIAVFAENAAETALAHLGGLLGGCSVVPVSFHLGVEEVAYILDDAGVELLFVDGQTAARGVAAAQRADVATVVGWGGEPVPGLVDWDAWLAAADDGEPDATLAPRPNLLYTSGTTGRPKGTPLPPTMFAGGDTVEEHVERLRGNPFAQLGAHLVVGPMYHTGPLTGVRLLAAGVPVVVLGRFDPEATLAAIDRHRIASTVMVPTHFVRLLQLDPSVRETYDVSSLRLVAHTGAACPVEVKRSMIEWWGPCFVEAYGASEVGTTCSITSEEWLAHPGSVGRPVPPFAVLVTDDDGNEVPAGTEGRLYFVDETGRGVVYHNDAAKSAAAHLRPGVFTLGEIGYVDDDGYVFITDRFSDMVVSGGVNIYPAESEQALAKHPLVADVACIGVPHPVMGEELMALVVPTDAGSPPKVEELDALVRGELAGLKCPRHYRFVESVGRNTMGKVNKRRLRDELLERA
jgi:long-chain acyl-CoA synthetase